MIKAEYIDHMGTDLTVVNAARVSFDAESDWQYVCAADCEEHGWTASGECLICENVGLEEKDEKLIKYLAKHNHFTPFTHCFITIRETVPIFVARQRFKHTVGFSYNEVSRRYVDDEPQFYTPDVWRGRPTNGMKQGSSEEEIKELKSYMWYMADDPYYDHESGYLLQESNNIAELYEDFLQEAEHFYESLIEAGVAPEQARMVLPQSMLTSYYVSGSLAAWARAYKLRTDSHAQKEIQELAKQWDEIISNYFPVSWKELTDAGC